jgi:PAS domain S-box-containing protein
LFGYGADEAVGRSLDLIIPERLRPAHWEGFDQAIARGSTAHGRASIITRGLHSSGRQLYVDMSFAVVSNEAGEVVGAAAVARDATQRHLEEKEQRRRLAELQAQGAAPPS